MPQLDERASAPAKSRRPWVFIIIGVAVLAIAAIIFSAAGPDRSRTTGLKDTVPSAVNPQNSPRESTAPNVDMPTAPKSR